MGDAVDAWDFAARWEEKVQATQGSVVRATRITRVFVGDDGEFYEPVPVSDTGVVDSGIKAAIQRSFAELAVWNEAKPVSTPPVRRSLALRVAAFLLPVRERGDWLEENLAYLTDIEGHRGRVWWVVRQVLALPRLSYTYRTDDEKEPA